MTTLPSKKSAAIQIKNSAGQIATFKKTPDGIITHTESGSQTNVESSRNGRTKKRRASDPKILLDSSPSHTISPERHKQARYQQVPLHNQFFQEFQDLLLQGQELQELRELYEQSSRKRAVNESPDKSHVTDRLSTELDEVVESDYLHYPPNEHYPHSTCSSLPQLQTHATGQERFHFSNASSLEDGAMATDCAIYHSVRWPEQSYSPSQLVQVGEDFQGIGTSLLDTNLNSQAHPAKPESHFRGVQFGTINTIDIDLHSKTEEAENEQCSAQATRSESFTRINKNVPDGRIEAEVDLEATKTEIPAIQANAAYREEQHRTKRTTEGQAQCSCGSERFKHLLHKAIILGSGTVSAGATLTANMITGYILHNEVSSGTQVGNLLVPIHPMRHNEDPELRPPTLDNDLAYQPTTSSDMTSGTTAKPVQQARKPQYATLINGSPFVRQGKLMDLDLMINDIKVTTIPDSGAHINAIPLSTLNMVRQRIERRHGKNDFIKLGNGGSTGALFKVILHCRLPKVHPGRSQKFSAVFHVFGKLATGVTAIIGFRLLDQLSILTTQSYRLKERLISTTHIPRCMSIGPVLSSGLRLKIFLNQVLVLAVPDTGSEINLISRQCADRRGFHIQPLQVGEEKFVEFADGQISNIREKVLLSVNVADCRLPTSQPAKKTSPSMTIADSKTADKTESFTLETFYVLDQVAHDVILSQTLLHSIDIWNNHRSALVQLEHSDLGEYDLCSIFWRKAAKKVTETASSCTQRESGRRRQVDQKRSKLQKSLSRAKDVAARAALQKALDELHVRDTQARAAYVVALAALNNSAT